MDRGSESTHMEMLVVQSNCTACYRFVDFFTCSWLVDFVDLLILLTFGWFVDFVDFSLTFGWLLVDCLLIVCWLFVVCSWIVSWLSVDYASPVAIRMNGISQVFSSSSAWSIPALCCPTSNRFRHDIHDSRHRKTKETCSSDQWPVPLCMDDYQCYPRTSMDVVLTMNVFMIDVRRDNAALTKPLPTCACYWVWLLCLSASLDVIAMVAGRTDWWRAYDHCSCCYCLGMIRDSLLVSVSYVHAANWRLSGPFRLWTCTLSSPLLPLPDTRTILLVIALLVGVCLSVHWIYFMFVSSVHLKCV